MHQFLKDVPFSLSSCFVHAWVLSFTRWRGVPVCYICLVTEYVIGNPVLLFKFWKRLKFKTFLDTIYSTAYGSFQNFLDWWLLLRRKLLNQGLLFAKLKSSLLRSSSGIVNWLIVMEYRGICLTDDRIYTKQLWKRTILMFHLKK